MACLPAMTVVPNFLVTGVLAVVFSLTACMSAAAFIHRKRGGMILISLSILLLFIGGGFIPPYIGLISGIAGTRINTPLHFWRMRSSGRTTMCMAALWPWTLIVFTAWPAGMWIIGHFFNQTLINIGFVNFFSSTLKPKGTGHDSMTL